MIRFKTACMVLGFSTAAIACGGDEAVPPPVPVVTATPETTTAPALPAAPKKEDVKAETPKPKGEPPPAEEKETPREQDGDDDDDDDHGPSCSTSIACINGACTCGGDGPNAGKTCAQGAGPASCNVLCRSCD